MASDRRNAPPENLEKMHTLKVDNISFGTTVELLKEKFGVHGEIGDVYIPRMYGTMDSRGYGFVRFVNKQDAEDAQRALDGTEIDGREIRIQEARDRRPDRPRDHISSRFGRRDDRDRRRSRSRSGDRRYRSDRRSRSRSRSWSNGRRSDRRGSYDDRRDDRGGRRDDRDGRRERYDDRDR